MRPQGNMRSQCSHLDVASRSRSSTRKRVFVQSLLWDSEILYSHSDLLGRVGVDHASCSALDAHSAEPDQAAPKPRITNQGPIQ